MAKKPTPFPTMGKNSLGGAKLEREKPWQEDNRKGKPKPRAGDEDPPQRYVPKPERIF